MELEQRFSIPVGLEEAWAVLLDVARVAPCFPGVELGTITDDVVTGSVRVKLGPVVLNYKGRAKFLERDALAHRVVIEARGSDAKGGGSASAKVVAVLRESEQAVTECAITTDLDITGRPAQFGRGFMSDVAEKITGQFASNLATMLTQPEAVGEEPSSDRFSGTDPLPAQKPIDLLEATAGYGTKRLIPVAAILTLIWVIRLAYKGRTVRSRPS